MVGEEVASLCVQQPILLALFFFDLSLMFDSFALELVNFFVTEGAVGAHCAILLPYSTATEEFALFE